MRANEERVIGSGGVTPRSGSQGSQAQPGQTPMVGLSTVRRGTHTSEWSLTLGTLAMIIGLLLLHGWGAITLPDDTAATLWALVLPSAAYILSRGLAKHGQRDQQMGLPADWPDAVSSRDSRGDQ